MATRLRDFLRDRRGATAVEFALVALPFIIMMLAIFEYAIVYLVTVTLDSATTDAARLIKTGQAQQSSMTSTQFKSLVCSDMGWLTSQCNASLYVDARVFSNFAGESSPTPVSNGKFNQSQLQFSIGGPGSIVLVTTYFQWTLLTPALQAGLSNMSGGIDVITARAAFRNEPYSS